jgi:hypothetical protein
MKISLRLARLELLPHAAPRSLIRSGEFHKPFLRAEETGKN